MTNIDSIFKSKDITLPTKVRLVKAMVFPVVMYGCESEWTPGVGDGQGGLVCCDSWSWKESDMTKQLNWTVVHWVGDAIQQSRPPSSPSPPAFNLFQHQGLFQLVSSLHQVAKVLKNKLQHQFFQWTFRTDFLYDGLVGSPCSPRDSQESSPTPQFKSINSSALSFLYNPTLTSIHDY